MRAKPTQLGFGLSGRKKKEKNCGDDAASPLPRSPPFLLLGIQIDLHDAHLVISSNSLDHALAAKRRRLHAQQRRLVGEFRVEARQFDGRTAPGVDGDGRGRVGDRDGGGARTEEREEHREGGEEHRRAGHRFVGSWKGGGGGGRKNLERGATANDDEKSEKFRRKRSFFFRFFYLSLSHHCNWKFTTPLLFLSQPAI